MTVLPATEAALLHLVADAQGNSMLPSLVAGVARDGRLVWSATRGVQAGAGPDSRPGPDMQYRIGSITKAITAISVLQCREDGLLDLDDALSTHVPDAPFGSTPLRRLLAHSGGLPAEPAGAWWESHDAAELDSLFSRTADQPAVLPAGSRFHYSNLGYALLGAVVGEVRRRPWWFVVRERVLEPLGMSRTTDRPEPPHATGFSVHPYSGRLHAEPHSDTGQMAPAGQLWSTLHDLARLSTVWSATGEAVGSAAGSAAGEPVLSRTSATEMATVHAASPSEPGAAYGLGLVVEQAPEGVRVGHGGSMPGFLAGLAVDPATGAAAVALSNGTAGPTPLLAARLLEQLLASEPALPAEWHPEPKLHGADEVLGVWYWGHVPQTLVVRQQMLRLEHPNPGRSSRFERVEADSWRGLDAYYAGEPLTVVRDGEGAVVRLELATYRLTREPGVE